MVGMTEEGRDELRFLWVDDIEKSSPEIVVRRFTRVVFRVSLGPFPLNATIKHHIERYKEADPEFVERFLRSIYVDDLSSGEPDVNAAYELYPKSKLRLFEGGFNLVSNSPELTNGIQCNESKISETASQPESTQLPQPLTERNVMSEEDKTYVKSLLGAEEETNSSE